MTVVPVEKFEIGGAPAFRFPIYTAEVRGLNEFAIPLVATNPLLALENEQTALTRNVGHGFSAITRCDGWVYSSTSLFTLDPSGEHYPNPPATVFCSDVYNALVSTGSFRLGNYTYKVTP